MGWEGHSEGDTGGSRMGGVCSDQSEVKCGNLHWRTFFKCILMGFYVFPVSELSLDQLNEHRTYSCLTCFFNHVAM